MTFALWTLPVAALLPYVTVALAKGSGAGYDNAAPRVWTGTLSGWRQRAEWAHRNHLEAFAPFAAAVIVASSGGRHQLAADILSGAFLVARIGYTAAYVADRAAMRSVLWFIGLGCTLALFCLGA